MWIAGHPDGQMLENYEAAVNSRCNVTGTKVAAGIGSRR